MNVLARLWSLTTARGWVLIALVAVGVYLLLGIPGVIGWFTGALAALSASEPWEEPEDDGRLMPAGKDNAGASGLVSVEMTWKQPRDRNRFRSSMVRDGAGHGFSCWGAPMTATVLH